MKIEGHFLPCPIRGVVFLRPSNKINPKIFWLTKKSVNVKIEGHFLTYPIRGTVFLLHSNKINPKIIWVTNKIG